MFPSSFFRRSWKSLSDLSSSSLGTHSDHTHRSDCFYGSFGKARGRKLPQRYYGCKRKDYPTKEGFLCVQSLSDVNRTWKLRYVMLFHDKLCYMKPLKAALDRSSGSMDLNVIHISDILSMKISSHCKLLNIADSDTFYVKTEHARTLFRCKNEEERDKWMTALLTAKSADIMKEMRD